MSELYIVSLTLLAGLAMPLGAAIARIEAVHPNWLDEEFRHGVIAFGGGALLAAVSFVLVPEGTAQLNVLSASAAFIAGGLGFMGLDIWLQRRATQASQLAAMLADFIPESMALGVALAAGSDSALLLALLIALQNLPEGFNAYRELQQCGANGSWRTVKLFGLIALLGPLAGLGGYWFLSEAEAGLAGLMLFAAGGILYSIFQDIAPQARLEKFWGPPMGAIFGFVLGMFGYMSI
ncbi:MAG: divalent cation transporter [Cellvibrionaceae bacterium]|nr:divalent cation transporter [Cellvibrionaceae bacterium]